MRAPSQGRPAISDLASLAQFILSDGCQSIVALTGAGVSVASGIPDFRSAGGMYDTLKPELLTASKQQQQLMSHDPTYCVSWEIFRNNQFPYLEVRRPFILGTRERRWKATLAHRFVELLHSKTGKLTRLYTQNIDGLDRQCEEIPDDKIVPVHGTLSKVRCEGCGHEMDFDAFCGVVKTQIKDIYGVDLLDSAPETSTPILCDSCRKPLVKPSTVLFGRSLPSEFFDCFGRDMPACDLLLVAGTSLVVSPANSLVGAVPSTTVRVIVNRDPVGQDLGIEYSKNAGSGSPPSNDRSVETSCEGRDLWARGSCDEVFLDLIHHLGWMDDLKAKSDLLPPQSAALLRRKGSCDNGCGGLN